MNAQIILDPDFPHGDKYGYILGCSGSHCPATVKCLDVHIRYVGDWAFRRALDNGMTAAEFVATEQEQAQEAAQADLRAKRARPGVRTGASQGDRRAAANRARGEHEALIPRHELRQLLNQGHTDRQIADMYGLERRQVSGTRRTAGWEGNPDPNRSPTPTTAPATTGASSLPQEAK